MDQVLVLKTGGKVIGKASSEKGVNFWLAMGEMGRWYRVYDFEVERTYPLQEG